MKKTGGITALGLALLGLMGTGISAFAADISNQTQSPLDPAGPAAQHISDLWYIILIPALIVTFGVGAAIIYIAFRYRRTDENLMPKQVGGNNALEFTWTLIPALILLGIFAISFPQMEYLRHTPAPTATTVKVTGRQWAWSFEYPTTGKKPVTTFGTLYIPAGKVTNLAVDSVDVIHSWSVPRLSGKIDAIPGKHNTTWIKADDPGTYYGQCTEFCGLSHAAMTVTVVALSQADYDKWYSDMVHKLGGS
ncbi:MAG: cytochrome c oxidase subunit [Chloroflexota bacterium]|nr:cytochrome c oxidase subunit [Chloroflexota bacterium]